MDQPGLRFRHARVCAGISIRSAAKLFGVDHSTIFRWERADIALTVPTQIKAAKLFRAPRNWLIFGEGSAPKRVRKPRAKAS